MRGNDWERSQWEPVCDAHLPHNAHTGVRKGIDRDALRRCVSGCIYHSKSLQTLAARHLSSESASHVTNE
jgi:hypothetical protein